MQGICQVQNSINSVLYKLIEDKKSDIIRHMIYKALNLLNLGMTFIVKPFTKNVKYDYLGYSIFFNHLKYLSIFDYLDYSYF